MALFRSIPEDVEAIKFCGMKDGEPIFEAMGGGIPSWLWKGITGGIVGFDSVGLKVHGSLIPDGAWIIHDGAFIDVIAAEKFNRTFVPARRTKDKMISAPVPISARKQTAQTVGEPKSDPMPEAYPSTPAPAPAGATVVGLGTPDSRVDEVDDIMTRLAQR